MAESKKKSTPKSTSPSSDPEVEVLEESEDNLEGEILFPPPAKSSGPVGVRILPLLISVLIILVAVTIIFRAPSKVQDNNISISTISLEDIPIINPTDVSFLRDERVTVMRPTEGDLLNGIPPGGLDISWPPGFVPMINFVKSVPQGDERVWIKMIQIKENNLHNNPREVPNNSASQQNMLFDVDLENAVIMHDERVTVMRPTEGDLLNGIPPSPGDISWPPDFYPRIEKIPIQLGKDGPITVLIYIAQRQEE